MDRRRFLRLSLIGTAGVAVSFQCGWSLGKLRYWLSRWFKGESDLVISDAELSKMLKDVYSDFRDLLPMTSPLLAAIRCAPRSLYDKPRWGGVNMYFDVAKA